MPRAVLLPWLVLAALSDGSTRVEAASRTASDPQGAAAATAHADGGPILRFRSGGSPADTIHLVDDSGHTLRLSVPPRRVVSLVPAVTELLFALGAGDRLVGRTRYGTHPEQARAIRSVGEGIRPSLELVLRQDPDLVILFAGSDNAGVAAALRRTGVPVLAVQHNSLEDLERNVVRIGRVTLCEPQAEALLAAIRDGLRGLAEALAGYEPRSVYYDVWADPPITIGAGSYLDALIRMAGGRNVFGDLPAASPQVGLEAIADRRPELILLPVGEGPVLDPARRPGWEAIGAVADGRVRPVDAKLVHRLGPRVVAAAAHLARAIHPEADERLVGFERPLEEASCPLP